MPHLLLKQFGKKLKVCENLLASYSSLLRGLNFKLIALAINQRLHNNFRMPQKTAAKTKKVNLKKESLYLFYCCAFLFILLIIVFNFDNYLTSNKVLGVEIEVNPEEKVFWENFTQKNPEYLDGWIELSKIYVNEGNKEAGTSALNKAREIDPNSNKLTDVTKLVL